MATTRITPACYSARLVAWLIDASLSLAIMLFVVYRYSGQLDAYDFILQTNYTQLAVLVLAPLLAYWLFMVTTQRSPGMYGMDLQLIQENGESIDFSHAMRRPLGLLGLVLTGGLATVIPFLNDRRRTIGDYLSGTRVVESLAPGHRISYDAWRIFRRVLKPLAPASVAASIALLLIYRDTGPKQAVLLDALLVAATATLLLATLIAGIKVKISRVRLTPKGIQRCGWFGWKKNLIGWEDIDYARPRLKRVCSYFEIHKNNRRRFRVPMEHDSATLTATALVANGVRLEQ